MAKAAGFKAGPYSDYSYDAAAMTLLAMQAAGSKDSKVFKNHVFEIREFSREKDLPRTARGGPKNSEGWRKIDYVAQLTLS